MMTNDSIGIDISKDFFDAKRRRHGLFPQVAALTILIELPEVGTLRQKKAASLTGLAPMTQQSGKWRGKARIQGGRKPLRDAIYMPALVAVKHNPDMVMRFFFANARKASLICLFTRGTFGKHGRI